MGVSVLVCAATAKELPDPKFLEGFGAAGLVTGVGPVNAACAVTRFLALRGAETVVSLGIGGAYPGSGLSIGDVVCASSECYADLGSESPEGFLDMEALGFPVAGGFHNTLPVAVRPLARALPFVTRTTCTGTRASAEAVSARTGGAVESMEGAAVVHAALLFSVPAAEIRGVSNEAGDRDRGSWQVARAADAAREALLGWLESR